MKKGISIWSFTGQPLETCFQLARKAGFDGVEVALHEQGPIHLASTRQDMAAVRNAADRQGVDVTSVASGLYWTYSLTADEPDVRAKARSIVVQQLRVASWLGCDTILVLPGSVTCGFGPQAPVVPYDVAYDRSLEALTGLAPIAADLGVAIGLENVWNHFLLSPLEMRSLIDAIGSPAVGAYFDVGNIVAYGFPQHWIRTLGRRIDKVHIKGFDGPKHAWTQLLAGSIDWPAVMAALREIGYNGAFTAELKGPGDDPRAAVKAISADMDQILGR